MRSDSGTTSETCFGEEFGSIWAPFWTPEAPQNHQKSFPEGIRMQLRIAIDFRCDFGPKSTPRSTKVDLAGGMRRAAVRRSRSVKVHEEFRPESNTLLLPWQAGGGGFKRYAHSAVPVRMIAIR